MPRNSSGTYSLPAGNPVVSNTLIETNWANPTMADIGQALTESLDRYGRGGMLAPFRLADGLVTAPALSFASETSTGIYRTTAGTWNLSILGVNVFGATSTGVTIVPPAVFTGAAQFNATTTFNAAATFNAPPLRAADPATADELTRKSYVDNLVTSSGTAFVKKIGDTMSGPLTITAAPNQFNLRSTGAGVSTIVDIGRASNDAFMGVSGGANQILTGDVAGDFAIRNNTGAIRLGLGASGYLTVNAANGVTVGGSFNAVGNIINNTALSGIRAGNAPGGLPAVQWANASGGANSKLWDMYASPTQLIGRVIDDAFSLDAEWLRVLRSAATVHSVTIPVGFGLGVGGQPPVYGPDIRTISVNATGQSVFDLQISGTRAGTFTVASGAGTAVILGSLGARPVELVTNSLARIHVSAGGLVGIGRTPVSGQLEISGGAYAFGSEGLRVVNDGGYISWFNSANTTRTFFLQNTGGMTLSANEVAGGYFQWNLVGAAGALTVNTAGAYVGPGEPFRLTRVNEFSISSTASGLAGGLKYRHSRVAAVVSVGGSVAFSSPFTTLYSCIAAVEGANGGGWIFRYHAANVNGFTYTWDQYNTAGSGAACFINYYAVGV